MAESTRSDGGTTLVSVAAGTNWGVIVSARNDRALQSIDADVGTRDVIVRAWPNDVEWQNFVVNGVGQGLPVLEDLIGQPWPIKSQLQITEATSSYLRGYAGWFSPLDNTIEVGEALDYETLLHELSHAWFNRGLFTDRWINEGFAEEYAGQALKKLGQPADDVKLDANSQYAVRLTDWGDPQNATGDAAGREDYGYHTAAWLMRQLTDEIGLANMAKVIRAVEDNTPAYGDTPKEFGEIKTDGTRLLDLLENVGGSKNASDLFKQYVSREADASLYDTRAASRSEYQELVDRGGSWTPPAVVRKELGGWHFAVADLRMTEARTVLDKRDQTQRLAAAAGATVPTSLESEYEKADTDLSNAIGIADRQLGAAMTLAQTSDRIGASRSITEKVGLWFAHPGRRLDQARQAFADDDTARATDLSLSVQREIDHAGTVGLHRIALTVAVLLLLVLVALTIRWVHHRPASTDVRPPPSPPPFHRRRHAALHLRHRRRVGSRSALERRVHLSHALGVGPAHEDDHARDAEVGQSLMSPRSARHGHDELRGIAAGARMRLAGDLDQLAHMPAAGRVDAVAHSAGQFGHLRPEATDDDRWRLRTESPSRRPEAPDHTILTRRPRLRPTVDALRPRYRGRAPSVRRHTACRGLRRRRAREAIDRHSLLAALRPSPPACPDHDWRR